MKLFNNGKNKLYQLIAYALWGNYKDVSEVVMTGTMQEIKEYASKNNLIWEDNPTAPNGGSFHKSIDGYRSTTFDVVEVKN